MSWIRSGECCRCGECCVGDPFVGPDDPNRSQAMRRVPPVPGRCPLYETRDGLGFCIGHIGAVPKGKEDPYYMAGCISWPDHPDHIKNYSGCSYTFEWVD